MRNSYPITSLSSKNQTVVPKKIREDVGINSGQDLLWTSIKLGGQNVAMMLPKNKLTSQDLLGLGKDLWSDLDSDQYISQLRDQWEK